MVVGAGKGGVLGGNKGVIVSTGEVGIDGLLDLAESSVDPRAALPPHLSSSCILVHKNNSEEGSRTKAPAGGHRHRCFVDPLPGLPPRLQGDRSTGSDRRSPPSLLRRSPSRPAATSSGGLAPCLSPARYNCSAPCSVRQPLPLFLSIVAMCSFCSAI